MIDRPPSSDVRPPLRLAFLIRQLAVGGAEAQIANLCSGLARGGHSVSLGAFYPNPILDQRLIEQGVNVVCLEKSGRWDLAPFYRRVIQWLQGLQPDILHSYLDPSNLLAALAKPFLPTSTRLVWGVRASEMDFNSYDSTRKLVFWGLKVLRSAPDRIVPNSIAGLEYYLQEGFSRSKLVVIPNGIDTTEFRPDHEARERVRAEWEVGNDEKLVGLVARMDSKKDHRTFLDAAATVCQRHPEKIRFVCVGPGSEETVEQLQRRATILGLDPFLTWVGARSDMWAVYNALDLNCLSSAFGEGFPNTVGESMACGTPCVVTDCGDSKHIIGETGLVVPPRSPDALANAILQTISADIDKSALQKRCRERIIELFDVERLIQASAGLYSALAMGR